MYCRNCGKQMDDELIICPYCGAGQDKPSVVAEKPSFAATNGNNDANANNNASNSAQKRTNSNDAPSGGFAFLSFIQPIIGVILFLVWREEYPLKAKSCKKGMIIGFSVCAVFIVLIFALMIIAVLLNPNLFPPTQSFLAFLIAL